MEPIRIATIFTQGRPIKPVWFEWRNRKHTILDTTYHWKEQAGATTLLHYSVTDGEVLFDLVYNTTEQNWLLNSIEAK